MASYEGRRSFLLGMTLNELAFMMFFLLMLLSTAALHDKTAVLEQQARKNDALKLELAQTRKRLDESFKRLQLFETAVSRLAGLEPNPSRDRLEQAFQRLQAAGKLEQTAEENARLKKQLQVIEGLKHRLLQIDPTLTPKKTLENLIEQSLSAQREHQNLRGRLHYLQQQLKGNGLDHPPCWADPENGTIQYLYRITIYEKTLRIEPKWPDERSAEIKTIPGASELAGQTLDLETFKSKVEPVYQWSHAHECRHFVRVHDDPRTTKRGFKTALLTIESVFYKYLEH
ncbi:MAG: hypothetical protein ACU83N_11110 [Gammaproteobacteria bacterium]